MRKPLALSCPAIAADFKPFDIYSPLKVFPVLGKAAGLLTEEKSMRCVIVQSIKLSTNEGINEPIKVTGIRFGVGVPKGGDDWGVAGRGDLCPFGFEILPGSTVDIPGTLTSCFADSAAKSEQSGSSWR